MKLSRGVFVVMALIAIVVLFSIALLRRPIDPLFEGKYASQWCEELLNSDYSIREAAKSSLQSLGERSVPQLRVLLNHRNGPWEKPLVQLSAVIPGFNFRYLDATACRIAAAEMLLALGTNSFLASRDLVAALSYDSTAGECERALIHIGMAAVPHLQNALNDPNVSIRTRAARILKEFVPFARTTIPALLSASGDPSAEVRREVAVSLGTLLGNAPHSSLGDEPISVLLELAGDRSETVRAAAMQALGRVGMMTRQVLSVLNAGLRDGSALVRLEAAKSLWEFRESETSVVTVLIDVLRTEERWRAAYVLGEMGEKAAAAVPALCRLLTEEQVPRPFRTPASSAFALGKVGSAAIKPLVAVLQHSDARVRMNALMAFGFMGKTGHAAIPDVMAMLKDKDTEVRHTAALTLASLGAEPEQMIASLSDCLRAEDIYMRSAAAAVLRKIAPDQTWFVPGE